MVGERFVIRRAFVVPLGLLLLLTLALLVVCLVQGQAVAKVVILGVLLIPLIALFVECLWRQILIDDTGVTAVRPGRTRRIEFAAVTRLEAVQVRSRVFVTLVAGEDEFLIISNSYSRFGALIRQLAERLPDEALSEEAAALIEAPVVRQADIVAAWLGVLALVYVLAAQFSP